MAYMNDLVEQLKPLLTDDNALQQEVKRKVVLDVDTKDAQNEFKSVNDSINSLKNAIKQAESEAKDASKIYENLGQTIGVAMAIVEEKLEQVGNKIKDTTQKLNENSKKLASASSHGMHGAVDAHYLKEQREKLEKELEARKKLQDEYQKQQNELIASQNTQKPPQKTNNETSFYGRFSEFKPVTKFVGQEKEKTRLPSAKEIVYKQSEDAIKSYEELTERIASAKQEASELRDILYNNKTDTFQKDAERLAEVEKQLKALEATKKQIDSEKDTNAIKNYDQLVVRIQDVKNEANTLRKSLTEGTSVDFQRDATQLANLEKELKELETTKRKIDSEDKTPIGGFTPNDYQELVSAIEVYKEAINEISQRLQEGRSTNFEQDVEDLSTLQNELKKFEATKKKIDSSSEKSSEGFKFGGTAIGGYNPYDTYEHYEPPKNMAQKFAVIGELLQVAKPHIEQFGKALSKVGSTIITVGSFIGNAVKNGFSILIQSAKKCASAIYSLATNAFGLLKTAVSTTVGNMKQLASSGFSAVARGVSAFKSGLSSVHKSMNSIVRKSTPNMLKSLTSLKTMLMRRIKRTFISSIFNQAKEGLQQLAKHSQEFNTAMSNIKNSAKQSAGNLSVTLGNLVTTVAPILETLLGWLNQVLTAVNSLFAVLSGKGTVTVATKSTDDYAKSLKNASSSAKDLNHQLYGFDEITRQEDKSGNGNGSKIGYEEKAVEGIFTDIMNMFKEGQFFEIGQQVGEKLSGIVTKIDDWVKGMRSKATEWARNIAEILNGIIDTDLFENLGTTIGDGINLVADTIGSFLEKFDFNKFGEKIGKGFNNLVNTIEWDTLGKTFALKISALWQTLDSAFREIDWAKLGDSFAIGIKSFFDNIDWDAHKGMIVNGINGVVETLTHFIDGIDWKDLSRKFFEHIKGIFTDINWEAISTLVSKGINNVIDVFGELNDSNLFSTIAKNLGETVGNILSKIDWKKLASEVTTGIAKIRSAFWEFVNKLNLDTLIKDKIVPAINGLLTDKKVEEAWNESTNNAKKGINKIIDAFWNLVDPQNGIKIEELASKLGQKVGDLLKDVDWSKLVTSILFGGVRLSTAFWTFLSELNLSNVATKIADGINNFFKTDDGKSAFTKAIESAKYGMEGVIDAFRGFVDRINLHEIADSLAKGINSFFAPDEGGESILSKTISTVLQFGVDLADAFSQLLSKINLANIRQAISDGINTIISEQKLGGIIERIGQFVIEASKEFLKLVGGKENGGIDFEGLASDLAKGINGIFLLDDGQINTGLFQELGKNLGNAIKNIFSSIGTFIKKTDWEAIGEAIGQALASIDWLGIAETVLNLLFSALIAVGKLIGGAISRLVSGLLGIDVDEARAEYVESYTEVAQDAAETFAEKYTQAMEDVKKNNDAKNAFASAFAEWSDTMNLDQVKEKMKEGTLSLVANALYMTDEELINLLNQNGGVDSVASALAETLGISQEQAIEMLGKYGIANKLAKEFGITYEEAMGYAEEDVVKAAHDLVNKFGISYEDALSMLGEKGYAQEIADALGIQYEDAVKLLSDQSNFDALGDLFADGADSAKKKILEGLYKNSDTEESVREYFKSIGITLTDDMIKSFVGAKPKILSSNRKMLEALTDKETWQDVKATLYGYGVNVSDELAKALTGQGMDNIDAALYLLGEGVNESTLQALDIANISENLKNFMDTTGKSLGDVATILLSDNKDDLVKIAKELGIEVGEDLGNITPEAMKKAILEGKKSVQEAADEMAQIADQSQNKQSMAENATDATQGVNTAVEDELGKTEGIENASEEIKKTIDDKIKELPEEEQEHATKMMDMLLQGILDGDPLVQHAIEESANSVVKTVSSILGGDKGAEITLNFINGMSNAINQSFYSLVENELCSQVDGMINRVGESLNYRNGYTLGKNVILGMYDAIQDYGQALVDKFYEVCVAIIETGNNVFNIHSPSRVFAEMGAYIMEGMENGILDTGEDAISAVSDVARAMIEEGKGLSLNANIGTMTDGMDAVADKLLSISEIFSGIAETLTQMGGLKVPTIATGQTIPYRTQLGASAINNYSDGVLDSDTMEDALYNAFTRAIGNSDNNQAINITLQIDGRKLADIVSGYQRQQGRAWGV